jgi:hypothetical protein
VQLGIEDLDIGGELQIPGRHVPRTTLIAPERDGVIGVHAQDDVLQVQDDVGDIFLDAGKGGELVEGVVEPHLGHRRPRDRRQQRPPDRIAERVAETGLEGAHCEPLAIALFFADGLDGRALDDEHETDSWVSWGAVCLGLGGKGVWD